MIELTTTAVPETVETEPLFSVDGIEYGIPVRVSASVGLEVATRTVEIGVVAGQLYALQECLGPKGFAALRSAVGMSTADLETIINTCVRRCQGEGPKAQG